MYLHIYNTTILFHIQKDSECLIIWAYQVEETVSYKVYNQSTFIESHSTCFVQKHTEDDA